ncbi:hypothetical protein [Phenylobacterium sp.]|uniref:hypothetical protein n=1 Tax=Phenylobacterium sp. TaxID=1871053 RepID=UPI002FE1CDDD
MKPTLPILLLLATAPSLAAAQPLASDRGGVPKGMVAFFQLNQCPRGWEDIPPNWQGRYLVATVGAEAPGQVVGEALAPRENRAAGAHTHAAGTAFVGGNCTDGKCAGWSETGIERRPLTTNAGAGLKAGTNAPYVALRACVRN